MTTLQTRNLGIEFERRIQEMYPNFKVSEKLDTDTIYSFLSEYQNKYIDDLFLLDDQTESGTKAANKINDIMRVLTKHIIITAPDKSQDADDWCDNFQIPSDYYLYIRSTSIIDKNYKTSEKLSAMVHTPNGTIKQSQVPLVVGTYYNDNGILRKPLVVLESTISGSDYIKVIHDKYTHIDAIDLTYYRQPHKFNVMKYNDEDLSQDAVHSYCELPYTCANDLVRGAVEMYISKYKFALQSKTNENKQ